MICIVERRPQGSPPILPSSPASTMNGHREPLRGHSRGGADVGKGGDPCGRLSRQHGTSSYTVEAGGKLTKWLAVAFLANMDYIPSSFISCCKVSVNPTSSGRGL